MIQPKVYEIKSMTDDKVYYVSINLNHVTCTCKDYLYRSHDATGHATGHLCKHCKQILREIREGKC